MLQSKSWVDAGRMPGQLIKSVRNCEEGGERETTVGGEGGEGAHGFPCGGAAWVVAARS